MMFEALGELWEVLSWADRFNLVAVVVGLPAATYYPFMFGRIRFWESDIGKSMFLKGIALMLVFWVAIGSVVAYMMKLQWYEWIQVAVNVLLVVAVWAQVLVMRRVQADGEMEARMGSRSGEDEQASYSS